MAEIKPLRAWRYNHQLAQQIELYVSPLFDVVSQKQREILYHNPLNSIHLSVPEGPHPASTAAQTLESWRKSGILIQDPLPAIYVYYQYFNLPGSQSNYCRKGFICNIRAYEWDQKMVLRHENTMPAAVAEQVELLGSTHINASATHGLYSDPEFKLESVMDESMLEPIMEAEDYQGVKEVVSVIHDVKAIKKFIKVLSDKQVILADGHHRYQGSLDYKNQSMEMNSRHSGNEGYNYHMMFLTNMEASDLRILATHRLVKGLPDLHIPSFMDSLAHYFDITEVNTPLEINEIILGKKHTFGLVFPHQTFKIALKKGLHQQIKWPFPEVIKNLDLTVLHYFVIEKVLGIPGKEQRKSNLLEFDRNFTECINRVHDGESQMALITNELSMEEVKRVCFSGYTLPPKSTYFYPKVVCGFVFGSLKEHENQDPHYSGF